MAGTRSHATDVRDSIEAKVAKDKDVEMRDRPETDGDDENEDAEDDDLEQDADGDSDAEAEEDADGEPDETGEDGDADGDADDWLSQIDRLQSFLCSYEKESVPELLTLDSLHPNTYVSQRSGACCWLPAHSQQTSPPRLLYHHRHPDRLQYNQGKFKKNSNAAL